MIAPYEEPTSISKQLTSLNAISSEPILQLPIIIHNSDIKAITHHQISMANNNAIYTSDKNVFMISHTPLTISRGGNQLATEHQLKTKIHTSLKNITSYKSAAQMIRANLKKSKLLHAAKSINHATSFSNILQVLPKNADSSVLLKSKEMLPNSTKEIAAEILEETYKLSRMHHDDLYLTCKSVRNHITKHSKINNATNKKKSFQTVGSPKILNFYAPKVRSYEISPIIIESKKIIDSKKPIHDVKSYPNIEDYDYSVDYYSIEKIPQLLKDIKKPHMHTLNTVFEIINCISAHHLKTRSYKITTSEGITFGKAISISNEKGIIFLNGIDYRTSARIVTDRLAKALFDIINYMNIYTPSMPTIYKYYVGKGNNHLLVKSIMQTRWWWASVHKKEIRNANLCWTQAINKKFMQHVENDQRIVRLSNHLNCHNQISNKKSLFVNLKVYYESSQKNPFDYIPLTFHIASTGDPEVNKLQNYFNIIPDKIWIIKPGENTNRGTGITIVDSLVQLNCAISECNPSHTLVIQKYIEKPLLINKRKFDIRCYAMITSINGHMKGFYYKEGYVRTSSTIFSTKDITNKFIHLTNDAIQKHSAFYGKFESGNKLSYSDLSKVLRDNYQIVLDKIKAIILDSILATYALLDPKRLKHSFEVYGFDFMIDEAMKVYLIEVNTNPCLETSCSLLSNLIPAMLDNCFRIAIDPVYQPPSTFISDKRTKNEVLPENKLELIFDEDDINNFN